MNSSFNLDRRTALKAGVAGGVAALLSRTSFGAAPSWMANSPHKLLTIFLRGGYDSLSAVIPHLDPGYTLANRGATFIPQSASITVPGPNPLGIGINPAMSHLAPLMAPSSGAPRIAFVHAVGNPARTGSHFDDQRTWETAITECSVPPSFDLEEGWVTRLVSDVLGAGFRAASVSDGMQQMYRTRLKPNNTFTAARVLPHIRALRNFPADNAPQYTLDTLFPTLDAKLIGGASPPSGLRALFSGGAGKDAFARAVGKQMVESAQVVAAQVPAIYAPLGGAIYPFGANPANPLYPTPIGAGLMTNRTARFFMYLRDAMALLRHVPDVNVAGIEIGGFDTHSNQGGWNSTANQIEGQLAELLQAVAFGIAQIDKEDQAGAFGPNGSITVLVVSEFGRTSKVNNSGGTDHGGSLCVIGVGRRMQTSTGGGVVFNDQPGQWPGMFSANDQTFGCPGNPASPAPYYFMKAATDFRAVYARVLRALYGATNNQIDQVIPNYSTLGLTEPVFIA